MNCRIKTKNHVYVITEECVEFGIDVVFEESADATIAHYFVFQECIIVKYRV